LSTPYVLCILFCCTKSAVTFLDQYGHELGLEVKHVKVKFIKA